jgi:hypothetical protein
MKRSILLTLITAWHLSLYAASDILPTGLAGTWGTAESLYAGTTAQSALQLEADGFGILVGSTPPAKRLDGVDDGKPLPRAVIGFPVRASLDGDTLTLGAYWPGKIDAVQAERMHLSCRYDAVTPALTCTGPDKVAMVMRRLSDTVDADAAKMIAVVRAAQAPVQQ